MSNEYIQSWQDIHELCRTIACKVEDQHDSVSNVIAISRGGLVPATIIAHELNVERVYSIGVKSYKGMKKTGVPSLYQNLSESEIWTLKASTGSTLIVDDICDTGDTFIYLRNELSDIDNTRFVSLILKPKSKFTPRYYAEKSYKWIVYPWELNNSK